LLQTCTSTLETVRYGRNSEILQTRWEQIRDEVSQLIEFRLSRGSSFKWYEEGFLSTRRVFESTESLQEPCDINKFPSGILGEVFFLNACQNLGIYCEPTEGDDDVHGADFKICLNGDTRFLDVSLNRSEKGLLKKNKVGTFPTVFIPWRTMYPGTNYQPSYAEKYLSTGEFDVSEFMHEILKYNYKNLHILRNSVWRDAPWGEGYMCLDGISYIKNLEGILNILRCR